MKGPPPRSLWPKAPPWILVLVGVVLVGSLVYKELAPPRDPKDAVREAFEDFVEAFLDRDRGDLWDMETAKFRRMVEVEVAPLRGRQPSDPAFRGSYYTWAMVQAGSYPAIVYSKELFDEYEETFENLELESISVDGDSALVSSVSGDRSWHMKLVLEDGDWKISSVSSITMKFMTLSRKLNLRLPKLTDWSAQKIDAVVRIGASGLSEGTARQLGEVVAELVARVGKFEARLVLDISAENSMQAVIEAVDILLAAGVHRLCFADTRETEVQDGVSVNGVPLAALSSSEPPPLSPDHPIYERIIGLR